MNTETSTLLALSQDYLLEFLSMNFGYTLSEAKLYVHNNWYVGANRCQILGDDNEFSKTGNTRQFSFYSDHNNTTDNWLLQTTPFSFTDIDSPFHANSEITGISAKIPYKIVRLYVRAGWIFPTGSDGIALKLNASYNGRQIDLLNFFGPSNTNLFVPASKNLYINNILYATYIEFKILDLSAISISTDPDIRQLFLDLIGIANYAGYNPSLLTNYQCEITEVLNTNVSVVPLSGTNTGGNTYNFTKFVSTDWKRQSKFLTDSLATINTVATQVQDFLEIKLLATGPLSLQEQLLQLTSDLQYIQIDHIVTVEEIDSSLAIIGIRSYRLSNDTVEWDPVQFIPILNVLTDSLRLTVRTRIQAVDRGVDISKFTVLVITGNNVNNLRRSIATTTLQVNSPEIVNKIDKQVVQVNGGGPSTTTINLKSNTVFVFSNQIKVKNNTTNTTNAFVTTEVNKTLQLYTANAVYSFEFLLNNIAQQLPAGKLYISETGSNQKHYEFDRTGTKAMFNLNYGMFSKKNFQIYDSNNNVIASFKILFNE